MNEITDELVQPLCILHKRQGDTKKYIAKHDS